MKFAIKNRWSGDIQFEADIDCDDDASIGLKIGLAVRWARSNGADLTDADLHGADLRGAVLTDADLHGADLTDADLHGADLRGAVLTDADLTDADLTDAVLRGAVLRGAVLRDADLSGADLRGDRLDGIPRIANIHQVVYEAARQPGALDMRAWHCGTTHCRAGWVVTLAGEGGKALEWALGTAAAAAIIYLASDPKIERIPDFYASNADALEDMKRLAESEAATQTKGGTR